MLCRIPYTYTVAAIMKGCRKIEPFVFGAWTDAEIPDISACDAPEAISWKERRFGQTVRRATRWFDGSNWTLPLDCANCEQHIEAGDFGRLPVLETQALIDRRGREPSYIVGGATGQDISDLRAFLSSRGMIEEANPSDIREMHYSGRQEAEDRTLRGARNLLLIDGTLWVKGGEPCYVLSSPGRNAPEHADASIGISAFPGSDWSSFAMNFFRADRLDDACDFLREISGREQVSVPETIEVHIPDAVQFDDEKEALLRCASQTVSGQADMLRHSSTESVLTWLALRDGSESHDPDLEALALHLAEARRTFASHGQAAAAIDQALRRWDLRPLHNPEFQP